MNVERIVVDKAKARELYRAYKTHQHYSEPIDQEIQRAYQLIAQGRMVIQALASIRAAGLKEDGWPKLALMNAAQKACHCQLERDGGAEFTKGGWGAERDRKNTFKFPAGTFRRAVPMKEWREQAQAIVPLVPIHLRPKRALSNYYVLWEAEWRRIVPVDPMLLRRIGGDMWLVVAAWDLTAVERAAMATRLTA